MSVPRVRPASPHQLVPVGRRVAASSRPAIGPIAATDEDVLLRLALWLADVAAEAAPAASFAPGVTARHRGTAEEPPMVESSS
jgi:hypothetical protein